MKKIEYFQCEICKSQFDSFEDAFECEKKPAPREYPKGLIFADNRKGAFYEEIIFCVAKNSVEGHVNNISLWACRNNKFGDSLGKDMCGSNNSATLNENSVHINRNMSEFGRMVKFLKDNGIPITMWNGNKAISLIEEKDGG